MMPGSEHHELLKDDPAIEVASDRYPRPKASGAVVQRLVINNEEQSGITCPITPGMAPQN